MKLAKRIASMFPMDWQHEMKRFHFRRQIKKGRFCTDEPEFLLLERFLTSGEWAIDVGANIGHYTSRLSKIVGPQGRIIAFEPIAETFSILADNLLKNHCKNVTLVNAALSNKTDVVGFDIPISDTGLRNFYQAHITQADNSGVKVLSFCLDNFHLANRISLVKIDAEGHELNVLEGMSEILQRDKPTLIVENSSSALKDYLSKYGYNAMKLEGSPNILFSIRKDLLDI